VADARGNFQAPADDRCHVRRWAIRIGIPVIVLALVGAGFWFVFVPHWRPPLRDGERYGIDVSSHQGAIDWEAVADDEITFAYIKATEGGDFVDESFPENWDGAGAAGLDRGAYHFFTLCRPGDEQAANFLATAPPDPDALPPAVDLELAGNCSDRPPDDAVFAELDAFLAVVEEAWERPALLYVGDDWDREYPSRARLERDLWHFRFLRRPDVDGWVIWQIHGFARVEGIDGPVDLDLIREPAG
jgi:lysozyme